MGNYRPGKIWNAMKLFEALENSGNFFFKVTYCVFFIGNIKNILFSLPCILSPFAVIVGNLTQDVRRKVIETLHSILGKVMDKLLRFIHIQVKTADPWIRSHPLLKERCFLQDPCSGSEKVRQNRPLLFQSTWRSVMFARIPPKWATSNKVLHHFPHHWNLISGEFASCIRRLPDLAETYYQNCRFDVCAAAPDEDDACSVILAFAIYCRQSGVQVGNWRTGSTCRKLGYLPWESVPGHPRYAIYMCLTAYL